MKRPSANNANERAVDRERILDAVVSEAQAFHKQIITIAVAFLGGTLLYLRDQGGSVVPESLIYLLAGWICLLLCMTLSIIVRIGNTSSGKKALLRDFDGAAKLDRIKERMSIFAAGALVLGIALITTFGAINLFDKAK